MSKFSEKQERIISLLVRYGTADLYRPNEPNLGEVFSAATSMCIAAIGNDEYLILLHEADKRATKIRREHKRKLRMAQQQR